MHQIRTKFTTRIATLTAAVLLATSTASAMQTTPPAKPITPERMARLSEMRRDMLRLMQQSELLVQDADREAAMEEASKLKVELAQQPESERTLETFELDATTLVLTSLGEPSSQSAIQSLVDTLDNEIMVRSSEVQIYFDEVTGTLLLQGPRWQVEEAKGRASDLNQALVQRIKQLRMAKLEQLREERLEAEGDERARRRAAEDALRAKTVNISWNGGSLGELIAAVQNQVACNVVLSDPSVAKVPIPALSVQLMAPEVFFQMLATLPPQPGSEISVFVVTQASIDPTSTRTVKDDGSMSAITISRNARGDGAIRHLVIDVRQWGKPDEASRLVDAIGFAMDAAGFTDSVKIRLHAPTNLMFVQGPDEAVRLANDVIAATKAK